LYLSFSYGLTAELSAAGIANVSSMDRLSAVSVVLLIAGENKGPRRQTLNDSAILSLSILSLSKY
jgi:hypothetical protein